MTTFLAIAALFALWVLVCGVVTFVDSHATPAFWLRVRLDRCQAGSWFCWRRAEVTWPLPSCARHDDAAMARLRQALVVMRAEHIVREYEEVGS